MKAIICALLLFAVLCTSASAAEQVLTLDVQDVYLSDALALLGAEAGVNIVTDSSVKPQRVTIRLKNVTFGNALSVITNSYGLQVRREGNVLIVGEGEAMNRKYDGANTPLGPQTYILPLEHAKPDDVAKELADALPVGTVIVPDKRTRAVVVSGPSDTIARAKYLVSALDHATSVESSALPTKIYRLHYIRTDEAIKQLKLLSPDGVYVPDDQHNSVLVSGSEDVQSAASHLVDSMDRPSPQVMFEVKVADVTPQTKDSNVGLEWGGTDLQGHPTHGSTTYAFTGGSVPVNVTLNALITEGRAQILATPKLVTINNKEADLLIGQTYPVIYNTSVLGGQNVQFVDIGVKLRLTPTIGPDGVVTAELHPEYSELLGLTATGYPIIANRKIDSTLRVADSQTIVLGGLLRDVDNETLERVPGLSSIPVLGEFFKNRITHHERDEIVFLITPHVIYPDQDVKPQP
ncbi:MAG: type II secretion system protein GspD [Candidatus Eremiobacteraeota bacterium]|nr:type II secretion system protein GspD [Candidatus Eremiobacteraeota bacterium]